MANTKHSSPPNDPRPYNPHLWELNAVRDLFWVVLFILVIWFGYYLRSIFTPVLISFFLAYLFNPVINWIENYTNQSRLLIITTFFVLMIVLGLVLIPWLGLLFYGELQSLLQDLPRQAEQWAKEPPEALINLFVFAGLIKESDQTAAQSLESGWETIMVYIRDWVNQIKHDPMSMLQPFYTGTTRAVGFFGNLITTTGYGVLVVFLISICFFFFSWKFYPMIQGWDKYIPASSRDETIRIVKRMDQIISAFFRGRVVISLTMGVMFSIGWMLCGIKGAFILGMITGLLNIFPYLSVVGWPFAILLKFIQYDSGGANSTQGVESWMGDELTFFMSVFFWPTVVYQFIQFLEGWFFIPLIQGKDMDLSAVTIIIVILVGAAVGGLYGMLLCIPIAACLKILLIEVLLPRLEKWASEN